MHVRRQGQGGVDPGQGEVEPRGEEDVQGNLVVIVIMVEGGDESIFGRHYENMLNETYISALHCLDLPVVDLDQGVANFQTSLVFAFDQNIAGTIFTSKSKKLCLNHLFRWTELDHLAYTKLNSSPLSNPIGTVNSFSNLPKHEFFHQCGRNQEYLSVWTTVLLSARFSTIARYKTGIPPLDQT